jgi:SAM-dependent methyltransferase
MMEMPTTKSIFQLGSSSRDSDREKIECLESNRIDPKFLYVTRKQADLWRQVFLKHSPIHGNPEFARIYREAFARVTDTFAAEKVWLVGLGCGTGTKEAELQSVLKAQGRTTVFSAIDVSMDLVGESMNRLEREGAWCRESLVGDLQSPFLKTWLGRPKEDMPRLITFFGLVPNLAPSAVARIFRAVLRPGDVLLASAHLAPVHGEGPEELAVAMKEVLPQYDNPETLAWISEGLKEWGLEGRVDSPKMTIGELEGMPAFLAQSRWKSAELFEKWGHRFSPRMNETVRFFYSLRYTPKLFEDFLKREGFEFEMLAITLCRQEAIWAIRCR